MIDTTREAVEALCELLNYEIAHAGYGEPEVGRQEAISALRALLAERDALRAKLATIKVAAEDATEYVLAQVNAELRDHIVELAFMLRGAIQLVETLREFGNDNCHKYDVAPWLEQARAMLGKRKP